MLRNLLHCTQYGTELGWLIEPEKETVLVVWPDQRVQMLAGEAALPTIEAIKLILTVDQLFSWLAL